MRTVTEIVTTITMKRITPKNNIEENELLPDCNEPASLYSLYFLLPGTHPQAGTAVQV